MLVAMLGAARLTNWGIANALGQLCWARWRDHRLERKLPPGAAPLPWVNPELVILGSGMLALAQIVMFTLPSIQHGIRWMAAHRVPALTLLPGLWLIGGAEIMLTLAMAYRPRRKAIWCAGWAVAAHIFVLGALWTQIQQ